MNGFLYWCRFYDKFKTTFCINETKIGQTKLCHHPPRSTSIHHDQPPGKIYPPSPTTIHHQPIYIHHHSPPAKIYPPPPITSQNISTTTYHFPKNGPRPCKSQNTFIYNLLLTLLQQFLFLRNAIFLSVMETLRDKVLISSFFKLQISITFYDIQDFPKFIFHEFKVTRFILFVFINKILSLFSFNQQFNVFFNLWRIDD